MPLDLRIVDENYVLIEARGEICLDDFVSVNEKIYSTIDAQIARFQIIDFTKAEKISVTSEQVRKIAEQDKDGLRDLGEIAIAIVTNKNLEYGLARMWQVYTENPNMQTKIFRDLSDAVSWGQEFRDQQP